METGSSPLVTIKNPFSEPLTVRLFWIALVLLFSLYALIAARYARPMIWADSSAGFRVWDSMRQGAAWNCYIEADPADLKHSVESFRTWWSPGQYVPAGLLTLTGLNLGSAIIAVTFVGVLTGLTGCWCLFRTWGFPRPTVMIAVAIIALGWHTSFLFGMFNGGELALFAGFPWIALAVTRLQHRLLWLGLALPALFLFGAFLKLSFPLIALCLCAGLWLGHHPTPWRLTLPSLRLAGVLGVGFVIFYGVLWFLFLSRGSTPGEAGQVEFSWPLIVGFSTSGPLLATGAFASLLARLVFFPGAPLLTDWSELGGALCLLAPLSIGLYLIAWKNGPGTLYRGMLLGFIVGYIGLFAWLYFRGASVSTDDRHFRAAGIVLIPGLVEAFRLTSSRWCRWFLGGLALLTVVYGQAGFANRVRYVRFLDNVGSRGVTQPHLSRKATALIHTLDLAAPAAGDTVFYSTSPEIALETPRVRVIQTLAAHNSLTQLHAQHFRGRVDNLLVIASDDTRADQISAILASFVFYDQSAWRYHEEGGSRFYFQGEWLESLLHGQIVPAKQLPNQEKET